VITPHLLLSLLLFVDCGDRRWLRAHALVSLVLAVFVIGQFYQFHGLRTGSHRASIDALSHDLVDTVKFSDGAPGWDNTILMHFEQVDIRMLGLPPGIGISMVYDWSDQALPPRSRYLLLGPDDPPTLDASTSMRKVAATVVGDVYARPRNRAGP
jgi:hypothetical protein